MENRSDAEEGYVYILGVKDIDLPVSKIGRTARDPAIRCAEINQSSTGDFLWEVTHQIAVNDCRKFEALVHTKLLPLRQKRREFFNIYPDDALRAVQSILDAAPDLRTVVVAKQPSAASDVFASTVLPRKQPARSNNAATYAHLLDGFTELLNVKGRPFGQLNKPEFGISDGRDGVQWNLKIYPNDNRARLGVNLEGMKYRNWPIASLIRSERDMPALLRMIPRLRDPQKIILRFARDAWQVNSRPYIVEQLLGGAEFRLSELSEAAWRAILDDALGCLDPDRGYLGRASQAVTLVRNSVPDAQPRVMQVSPHLTIWTALDPSRDSLGDLSAAIDRLAPVHEWASKASGA
jgi:hypothetical protein